MVKNLQAVIDTARDRALETCVGYARWAPQIAGRPDMVSLYINTTLAAFIVAYSQAEARDLVDDWRRQAEARKAKVA